jgi:hypothetical protein
MDGWAGGRMDGWMDGQVEGWMDVCIDNKQADSLNRYVWVNFIEPGK